ncbi:carbohydrate sulfotransferase 11-like isoform X2 [Clytia hemisphaerica]|uniref:carbohydrate sulfotransferase 11-like isoform X2 n=1 Tax=Clytia hemisphaerica TaxID=252671 RepID=UPI0034D7903E
MSLFSFQNKWNLKMISVAHETTVLLTRKSLVILLMVGSGFFIVPYFVSEKPLSTIPQQRERTLIVKLPNYQTANTSSINQSIEPKKKPKSWMKTQYERQQRLREFCAKKNLKTLPQPKFAHNWIYSDKARVSYCSIPKVACTTWKKLFQVFYGRYNDTQSMKMSKDAVHELKYQYHMKLNQYEANLKTMQYFNFIIVRHPLERLVSGYRNKIEKPFTPYFQKTFGSQMLRLSRKNLTEAEYRAGKGVTFHEYINYIIKTPMRKIDEHFGGMIGLCHICNVKYDFIADMSTLYDDSDIILKLIGWYDRHKFPRSSKDTYKQGAVDIAPEYINRLSDDILKKVYEKFKDDFEAFGYKFDIKGIRNGTFY